MMNILFTSAGRRVELLRAFREAYQALGLEGRIVALDTQPLAPALRVADRPYIVPSLSSPEYIPTLTDLCRREEISMVIPLIDPDLPLLSQHRDAIEATGARLLVCDNKAIMATGDKWLTMQFFQTLELPVPCSYLPHQIDRIELEYPVFVKPRNGSASQNTFQARNPQELAFFSQYVPDAIIQEYLPGPEITSDVMCDLKGEVLSVVSRRRIQVRSGEVAKGVTVYDPVITRACVDVARGLQAIGPISVQCMLKDGMPRFTEVNPRFGGGMPLSIAAGADLPRWLLAEAAGLSVEIPPLGTYRTGLYMSRFDDSFFITEDEHAQMAARKA